MMADKKKDTVAKKPGHPKKIAPPEPTRIEIVESVLNLAKCYNPNGRSYYTGRNNPYVDYYDSSLSVNVDSLVRDSIKKSSDQIWNYCVDRIFRALKIFDEGAWTKQNYTGYYEEVYTEVNLCNSKADQILQVLVEIDSLNDCDKIKKCLELEYGYVLPMLERKTKTSIVDNVSKDNLYLSENYMKKINKEDIEIYNKYDMPCAVCIRKNLTVPQTFSVIDGYHRTLAAKNNNKISNVSIILME
jgi:hypothetical protein